MPTQLEKLTTGLAGEYLVAGMLSLKGYVASLTLKNYPGIDIFVLNPQTNISRSIQVKARRGNDIPVGGSHKAIDTLPNKIKCPFVFVRFDKAENIEYYIVPPQDLIQIINETDKEYYTKPREKPISDDYPMAIRFSHIAKYKDQWDLIWK